jgi:hypothetical protein
MSYGKKASDVMAGNSAVCVDPAAKLYGLETHLQYFRSLFTLREDNNNNNNRLCLKCDGTREETRFRLSAKRTSPLKRRGRQFSRLLAAEVCASAVVMLDTPCSEVV